MMFANEECGFNKISKLPTLRYALPTELQNKSSGNQCDHYQHTEMRSAFYEEKTSKRFASVLKSI